MDRKRENGQTVSVIEKLGDGSNGLQGDRKRTEEELANHYNRLEAIFGSVKDAIITVDPELRVMEANKSAENICGMNIKKIKGKMFTQCPNPCKKSCFDVLVQTLEMKITIKEYRIECNHQQRYQQIVNVTSSPLLDPTGKFIGAVLVLRDMTLVRGLESEPRERHQFENIVGRGRKMQDVYRLLEDLTNLETTVLVTGESGTGKELIARALHYSGLRAFNPFVTVNCSALAENLLESELFGHVKGAFTGAIRDKVGRFQAADGGTIVLDEIDNISSLIQLKLLRVIQEKEFERVGESVSRKVDVRLITCTNKDLKERVRKGEFREDLYYRLKVVEVSLPSLRDRLEDLPLLVDHFCHVFNDRFKKNIEGLSSEVLGKFMEYDWPGNVRELEHVMEHAFVLCHGRVITLEHLALEIRNFEMTEKVSLPENQAKGLNGAQDILNALNKTSWNKSEAARLLGIARQTVYRKIYQYSLVKNA